MSRTPRTSLPDGFFHVSARGVAAAGPLFRDDDDRRVFMSLVWRMARAHAWRCHAICLLGRHHHLVLESQRASLSSGLHRLNWHYARYFSTRHDLFGHVFASRFSARSIESEAYLYDACVYVLLNPVKAGSALGSTTGRGRTARWA